MVQLFPQKTVIYVNSVGVYKNMNFKYKDSKPVPAGFVYTGDSRNKYQQREYLPFLNPKECTNESDITEVIDPRFLSHSSTGWITDKNGSRRKVNYLEILVIAVSIFTWKTSRF